MNCNLTHERLLSVLSYDSETGIFTWLINSSKNVHAGHRGGCQRTNGYRVISVDKHQFHEHRLAFFYMHGRWPSLIDHINGNPSDNRISNLREVTHVENMQNLHESPKSAKVPLLGVSKSKNGRFRSFIKSNGKQIYLGTFDSANEAHQVYIDKKKELHKAWVPINKQKEPA